MFEFVNVNVRECEYVHVYEFAYVCECVLFFVIVFVNLYGCV